MDRDRTLREHVLYLLRGGGAHLDFEAAIADLPATLRGTRPPGVPHTPWRLLEHLRIAQWDILEFCRNPRHVSPKFPDGYWPAGDAPPDPAAWDRSVAAFRADLKAVQDLVADPAADLFAPIPHGEGQTILREALLVADHLSYHLGQLVVVRRALGSWSGGA
jgi:hypothetical protein